MEALGIRRNLLTWIEAWLEYRKQRVVLNGAGTEWCTLGSKINFRFIIILNFLADVNSRSRSLNGLICLHNVLDKAGSQSVFKRT